MFARHHIGVEKFISTSREDRTGIPRDQRSQMDMVSMEMEANIEAVLNISEKRLCFQADPTTREYWKDLLQEIKLIDEDIYWASAPQCVRCGGCPECFGNCKYYESIMKGATEEEQRDIIKRYDYYNKVR